MSVHLRPLYRIKCGIGEERTHLVSRFQPLPIRITALDDSAARIHAHFAARHAGASDCERKIGVAGGGPEQAECAREEAAFADALDRLADANLHRRLVIDASHANGSRRSLNQVGVCADIAAQIADGSTGIAGVMIESNLVEGRQDVVQGGALVYGQSITDGCLSIGITVDVLAQLAHAVRARRAARTASGDSIPQAMTAFDTVA
ncbi:hypothetical protein KTE12_13880 [Burkholderia multivorans]|nr:hypothetical protein [Burkholderia multivorans]